MTECKHGLKQGCFYCHNRTTTTATPQPIPKRRTKATRLSEQMNDRMTNLKQRLRQLRGE
jgi:histone acetyltransferase (RNA polymerase elongator complex component)